MAPKDAPGEASREAPGDASRDDGNGGLVREAVAGERPDTVQPADEASRHLARRLIRLARFGALGVLDPADGAPFVSRVALASEMNGTPVMLVSTLARHTQALAADARCSLLVGEPGKGDPLAHPRLSVAGQAERIERDTPAFRAVRRRYLARHPKAALYVDFADFAFFRMHMARASLNGGFGRAHALGAADLGLAASAELDGLAGLEAGAVAHMNEDHGEAVALYATRLCRMPAGAWRLASLDPEGLDLVDGDRVARVDFEPPLATAEELRPRLAALAQAARAAK